MHVVVVGAGLAGLVAARTLHAEGHRVTVLDKGRSPGGRLATRRIGAATLDHGAQFFTVRDDRFGSMVAAWAADGLVAEWCRGFTPAGDGYPRFAVPAGMNALAKHLAAGLDVRCRQLVFAVRDRPGGWDVGLDDGTAIAADAVVVTTPVPQSQAVLISAGVELPAGLRTLDYDRTLALLVVLDGPTAVPAPGGVQSPDALWSFVGDNQAKGVSAVPALTLHAAPDWSGEHWDDDPAATLATLVAAAQPWFGGSAVVEAQLKRWRFATPRTTWHQPCYVADDTDAPVVLAGDAFAGPRVEGAALSGLAAARALID